MIIETTSTKNTQVVVFNLCGVIHAGAGETVSNAAADLAEILVDKEVEPLATEFEEVGGLIGDDAARIRFFKWAKNLGYKVEIICSAPDTGKSFGIEYKKRGDLDELDKCIDSGCAFRWVDFSYTGLDEHVTVRYRLDSGMVEFEASGGFNDTLCAYATTMDTLKEKLAIAIKDFLLNHR